MAYEFHFNNLKPHQRERIAACFTGEMPPVPIHEEKLGKTGFLIGMGVLSTLGLFGLLTLLTADYGRPYSGMQEGPFILAYGIALFMLFYGIIKGIQRFLLLRSLPFAPGFYLFPLDLVDATSATLKIYPLSTLSHFQCTHQHTNGVYTHSEIDMTFEGGGHKSLQVSGRQLAEEMLDQLDQKRALFLSALEAGEMEIVAALDPFLEMRIEDDGWSSLSTEAPENPEGETHLAAELPYPLRLPSVVALILGLGMATPTWGARNYASDAAMFEKAKTGSAYEMKAYLRNGKRFVKEMKEEVLPAKEFADAKKKNSVDAMREYLFNHPNTKFEPQAREHIGTLYAASLAKFEKQANQSNPELKPFMKKLLKYLELHDSPPIEVSFRPPPTTYLKLMYDVMAKDFGPNAPKKLVKEKPIYKRPLSSPLPYFKDSVSKPREAKIVQILQNGFAGVFTSDILHLEEGHRLPAKPPAPKPVVDKDGKTVTPPAPPEPRQRFARPTIVVDYVPSLSGQIYTLDKDPNRVFTGIRVFFDVEIHIPGEEEVLKMKLDVEPPKTFSVGSDTYGFYRDSLKASGGAASTGQVYNVMAVKAFERLVDQMRDFFFAKNSKAWKNFKPKKASTRRF